LQLFLLQKKANESFFHLTAITKYFFWSEIEEAIFTRTIIASGN